MLDSPIGTGKWALVAGEETRRSRLSGLYSPAGPEARDESPGEVSLPLTHLFPTLLLIPLTTYLLVAQYLACGWVSLGL